MLCIFLFNFGVVSFRSIPRILEVFKSFFPFFNKIYHFTSIINWSMKLGYYKLNNICKIPYEWTAIVDSSIKLGNNKLLLILSVKTEIMKDINRALTLKDVEIVGLFVKESLTADIVKELLEEVFVKTGNPRQIVTDGGKDLIKGVNTLKTKCIHSLDVGHFSANILKNIYEKNTQYKSLIEFTSNIGLKLRQTVAGWIIPPKLRSKGRFQNISLLAYWVKESFEYYENYLEDCDTKTKELLKETFKGYEFLKMFSACFYKDCEIINQILKIIKNEGLSRKTFNDVIIILSELSIESKVRIKLEAYFIENMEKLEIEEIDTLMLSSDIIESIFGKIKYIIDKAPIRDFNRLSLLLPTLVGSYDEEMIMKALHEVKINDIKKWQDENIGETLFMKRKREFSKVRNKTLTSKDANSIISEVA